MRKLKPAYFITLFCLAGTAIRILYGYFFHPWNQSPDQLAWGIILQHGNFSYDELIHYPYEGGSIPISLACHFIQLFTNFNSLTIAALLFDFISRFIQLYIVRKLFSDKIVLLFGLWTIFATPSILPWGTVNFGLHSISAFFPFVLLYLLARNESTKVAHFRNGIFLGLACWFSYSNFILIPVYFLYHVAFKKAGRLWWYALASFCLILTLHVIVKINADAGFHLDKMNLTSIRGTSFMFSEWKTWKRILTVWTLPLADAAVAVQHSEYFFRPLKYVWILIVTIGMAGCFKALHQRIYDRSILINVLTIFLFMIVYAISPFYPDNTDVGNYVTYRHLTYILPLISLFAIVGLDSLRFKTIGISIFLLLSIFSSCLLFTQKPATGTAEKEAGWVLGEKLGHDPERLSRIISTSHYNKYLLMQGVGWGISTALFNKSESEKPEMVNEKIQFLVATVNRFPDENRKAVIEGIIFSFTDEVTPKLDKNILPRFQDALVVQAGQK